MRVQNEYRGRYSEGHLCNYIKFEQRSDEKTKCISNPRVVYTKRNVMSID